MKRRNADCGKLRRPIKRNKITEGMYGSNTLLYIKFLVLWAIVITADFMLEFRFEFLWPFWLLLRSVHDSFKYKGLAFSVLFVCIAITSDLVCLFFIPVHWLFFAASTYVWVQYVWHTDKGICLPTIILWMLFVYLEAAIRWKDSRHMPHLDLCRPFAAHCIGYPVVTLGFGFKSYVGYRMRQRKQREVAKENEFYMQLLQQALPQDETQETGLSMTSEQQATGQQDIQQKELSPVTAISVNNNNNSTNNKNNAQNNSKHNNNSNSNNSNLFNNSNGHVMMTAVHQSVMPHNVSNGVNHLHNNNSHKNNSHRRSLDKETSQMNNSNFLNSNNSKLTDSSSSTPHNNTGTTTIAMNSSSSSSSSSSTKNSLTSSNSNTQSSNHRDTSSCHATGGQNKKLDHDSSKHNGDLKSTDLHHYNQHHYNGHCVPEQCRKHQQNGSILNYDVHEANDINQLSTVAIAQPTETVEKHKSSGRKNRVRQKNNLDGALSSSNTSMSKDNQQQDSGSMQQQQYVSQHQQTMPQVCESCVRLENEAKKMKQEINHLKQTENELRQKIDSNINYKNCLQAKQRENDDLEKRIQELTNSRQLDRQNLQNTERRLGEERRQKQSLESQLNNERKQRKLAEERAARSECGDLCKMKKQQLEMECNKMRRDYAVMEDAKNNFEHQNRNYEQELQKFKNEIRNREQQQGAEVLMSALNAMQVKNSTLEKNLSDETRVKLDLFSALGEAKRQLEISDSHVRTKEKEVNDLQTKIAQLLAVMPCHDSLCIGNPSSNTSSILRVNDTPPLLQQQSNQQSQQQQQQQQQGGGPSSPMSQLGLSVSPLLGQLSNLGVLTSTPPPHPPQISISSASSSSTMSSSGVVNGQQVQMQNSSGSNLDPNATAYTPKNNNGSQLQVGGTEA